MITRLTNESASNLISNQGNIPKFFSTHRPQAGLEPVLNLSSDSVTGDCPVLTTTTRQNL